jgi:hypothetical protein
VARRVQGDEMRREGVVVEVKVMCMEGAFEWCIVWEAVW